MLFNSYEFIFLYLPVVFFGFFCIARSNHKLAALWLAVASLFFYGWWNPRFVLLLLASVVFNYVLGSLISPIRQTPRAKVFLVTGIATNLVLLGVFKYVNFFIVTLNSLTTMPIATIDIVLPLGISFFTFTQIAFLVDVQRGLAREYNFIHYLLFVTYFPHLIAGPILHHSQLMPQFAKNETYRLRLENVALGLSIFTCGMVKKVLLADSFGEYAIPVFSAADKGIQPNFVEAWTGALAYSLQLYFDFSGYSDMAIGLSRLFGVRLPINFDSPYKAPNIIEFWRRWHMSLSQFLQHYLYIPLGGNRNGKFRRYVNIMITMLLGGLWHGANWTFVIWGCLHGLYLLINHAWRAVVAGRVPVHGTSSRIYYLFGTLLTFFCVVVAWIFFRAESWSAAVLVLKGCFGYGGFSLPVQFGLIAAGMGRLDSVLPAGLIYDGVFANITGLASLGADRFCKLLVLGLLLVWFAPNSQQFFGFAERGGEEARLFKWSISWQPKPVTGFLFGCAFLLALSNLHKVTTFLYYQF